MTKANNTSTISPNDIEKLYKFFEDHSIDYDKAIGASSKTAYPNYDQYMSYPAPHDTQKWVETVKSIYQMEKSGHSRVASIRQATNGWKITETFDFLNWLRFYEGANHLKYKMAQLWYENGAPGYFLHVKPDPAKEEEKPVSGKDIDFAREESTINAEKRQVIERQRNKIIGRLDSAEKLMRAPDGQMLAGPELEAMMEAIYQLKKKIQLVNKISTATKLYDDMIVREANILHRNGFVKAADILYSTAQANNPPPDGTGKPGEIDTLPPATPPESPSAPLHPGSPGGLPSMGPGMSQNAPASTGVPNAGPNDNAPTNLNGVDSNPQPTTISGPPSPMPTESPAPPGIQGFLDNMETANVTTMSDKSNADVLEVQDDELMVVEAQLAPPEDDPITTSPPATKPNPSAVKPQKDESVAPKGNAKGPALHDNEPLEVSEDDVQKPTKGNSAQSANIDRKIDEVLKSITFEEIINEIDMVAGIFRQREIPSRIARIDLMLKNKGLSSYFPSIGEMLKASLDSNNYCSTRIEDILSKLRGFYGSGSIDINEKENPSPDVVGVKEKLQQDAEKEKRRKQQRKEQEAAEFDAGIGKPEAPEVEIDEDLKPAAPLAAKPAQPAAKPAAPAPTV